MTTLQHLIFIVFWVVHALGALPALLMLAMTHTYNPLQDYVGKGTVIFILTGVILPPAIYTAKAYDQDKIPGILKFLFGSLLFIGKHPIFKSPWACLISPFFPLVTVILIIVFFQLRHKT